jgi:hypothetical protein
MEGMRMFVYDLTPWRDRTKPRRGGATAPSPEKAAEKWAEHARNRALLEGVARDPGRSLQDRAQARDELLVAERKLEWWGRHTTGASDRFEMGVIRDEARRADRERDVRRGTARGGLRKADGRRLLNRMPVHE